MQIAERVKRKIRDMSFGHTQDHENDKVIMGQILLELKRNKWDTHDFLFEPNNWDEYGFSVFSQNNEDGLIQYILKHTKIEQKVFVEFGVEDYREANTRFLLLNNNWSGLVMDGNKQWMDNLKKQDIYWKRTIEAKGIFITKDNIDEAISQSGIKGEIGLLSVDIDGNDYWVLNAIKCISPTILICEFNPIYGREEKVSIIYKDDFYRKKEHFSDLHFGASLSAFISWANERGYKLVCINNLGNNAFFVKKDKCDLPEVSVQDAWRNAQFRESRDQDGNLTFLSMKEGKELIGKCEVIDVETSEIKRVEQLRE